MQDVRDTLWYDDELNALVIIDQTQLPNNEVTRVITDEIGLVDAISSLAVRGAPAIGVAAAIGCAVVASRLPERDFEKNFTSMCERVAAARPTAVNLRWAVERLMRAFDPSVSAEESCRRLLRCALEIRDEDISVCTAIGDNGVGLLKDGDAKAVEDDIRAVVEAVPEAVVKVIIETCLLTREEKIAACRIAEAAGAKFVKTSTGFSTGGATVEDVRLMRDSVSAAVKVKASGGIRDAAAARAMIEAGAERLGTSRSIAICREAAEKEI